MGNQTTFKAGDNRPRKPKGTKDGKTLIKEKVGLTSWDTMCNMIVNEGIDKYIEELFKLKGKDFIFGYTALIEYVKPKLQRTSIDGNINTINAHVIVEL